jgi:5-methylcytosine-specific restriction endonuclease McrA
MAKTPRVQTPCVDCGAITDALPEPWRRARALCEECRRSRRRASTARYRDAHRDEIRSAGRAYVSRRWAENPARERDRARAYQRTRSEAQRATRRRYYEAHPAECRERVAAWKRANPEKVREQRRRSYARRKGAWRVDPVTRTYVIARDGGRCHLCGKRPRLRDLTIDHVVPISRGGAHVAENMRVACRSCNCRKGARAVNEQLLLVG